VVEILKRGNSRPAYRRHGVGIGWLEKEKREKLFIIGVGGYDVYYSF
jgi:hypothetical protein